MNSSVHPDRMAITSAELERLVEPDAVRGTVILAENPDRRATTAADMMIRFPLTAHQGDSLWTAWGRLHGTRHQHLVVVDDHHRAVGVLDERTIALEWPSGPMGAHRTPVHSLLRHRTRPSVQAGDDVGAVARTMLGARADAVPVVDRDGRLLGLLTLWHLAELVADDGTEDGPREPRLS